MVALYCLWPFPLQCSAIWQVSIFIDSILICPGRTSLVLHNYYCLPDPSHTAAVFGRSLKHFFSQRTSVHSASEAFATMRYINWCFTYLLPLSYSSQSKIIVLGLPWTFFSCICPSSVIVINEWCLTMWPSHLFCRLLTVSIVSLSVLTICILSSFVLCSVHGTFIIRLQIHISDASSPRISAIIEQYGDCLLMGGLLHMVQPSVYGLRVVCYMTQVWDKVFVSETLMQYCHSLKGKNCNFLCNGRG